MDPAVERLIDLALDEDLGRGDVTSESLFQDHGTSRSVILAKQPLVVFGLDVAARVFQRVDQRVALRQSFPQAARVPADTVVAHVEGPTKGLLAAERTALNFLQRLSGVATLAARFADLAAGTRSRIIDTRKTTPGWRALEKAAVRAGGCGNHRADLASGLLIKDNHIAALGGVRAAVERARARAPHTLRIEVEVKGPGELDEALAARAEVVLLDNFSDDDLAQAIPRAHAQGVLVEVSGGITLERVAAVVALGPDFVSVGALTHSAPAVDLSLDFE